MISIRYSKLLWDSKIFQKKKNWEKPVST